MIDTFLSILESLCSISFIFSAWSKYFTSSHSGVRIGEFSSSSSVPDWQTSRIGSSGLGDPSTNSAFSSSLQKKNEIEH